MCDQVARLQKCGINTCYYNTLQDDSIRQNIIHNLKQEHCQYQFVFVSPEAVITDTFQSCLNHMNTVGQLSFFIVDEAHCIDTWGKDFRPAYQQLGILKKYNIPVAALTGTATSQTLEVIKSALKLENPCVVKLPCRRENLMYKVVDKKETKSKQQVATIIANELSDTCSIIYCATQPDTVEMEFVFKQHDITTTFYHAC